MMRTTLQLLLFALILVTLSCDSDAIENVPVNTDVVDAELFVASIRTQRFVAAYQYMLSLSKLLALSVDIHNFKHYQSYQGIEVK